MDAAITVVFIGGPLDGHRTETNNQDDIRTYVINEDLLRGTVYVWELMSLDKEYRIAKYMYQGERLEW